MTLQEHALRALVKGWMISVRAIDRETFEQLSIGFLFGPEKPTEEVALPGLTDEVAIQLRSLLEEIGEQELLRVDGPRQ